MSERQLDILIDHLNTLNDTTPKIKCQGRDGVDPSLVMGLDSTLFQLGTPDLSDGHHHDEVQTVTVYRGHQPRGPQCTHPDHSDCGHSHSESDLHPHDGAEVQEDGSHVPEKTLTDALSGLSKETVWRVKGFVRLESGHYILNWAFGRHELTPLDAVPQDTGSVKLTVMGERGEVKRAARKFAEKIGANIVD